MYPGIFGAQGSLWPNFNFRWLPDSFVELVTREPQTITTQGSISKSDYLQAGKVNLFIEIGAGSAATVLGKTTVPEQRMELGVGNLKLNKSTIQGGGTFTTDNYATAEKKLEMDIDVGIGRVQIITK